MGLWSSVTQWWNGEAAPASEMGSACAVAEPESLPVEPESADSDNTAPPPWWGVEGEGVVEAPERTRSEVDPDDAANEDCIRTSLEAALADSAIELPHMPQIAQQVLLLTRRSDTGMPQIARLISQDQVLAADLLRRANSAAFGGVVKVTALGEALTRLGMRGLRQFVISRTVKDITIAVGGVEGRSRGETLWKQALAASCVAAAYGDCFGADLDEAFLMGLLHDIGKVPVLRACHEAQQAAGAPVSDAAFDDACEAYHERMGRKIADHWELPPRVAAVIADHHHDLGDDDLSDQRALIQLTDATLSLLGYTTRVPYDLLALPAARRLGAADNSTFRETLELLPEVLELTLSES